MRWVASLVAELHRILMRGGVFLYPRDTKDPNRNGRVRLLYEANPVGFIVEQAGGRASTGYLRILDVPPEALHQRIGLISRLGKRSRAHRAVPPRPQRARLRRAAVRRSRPVPRQRLAGRAHVRPASDHRHHRILRRRHHVGDAHLRADLPPRGRQCGVRRGRQFPPPRPRRDAPEDGRGGRARQPQFQPFRARGKPVRGTRGAVPRLRRRGRGPYAQVPARR